MTFYHTISMPAATASLAVVNAVAWDEEDDAFSPTTDMYYNSTSTSTRESASPCTTTASSSPYSPYSPYSAYSPSPSLHTTSPSDNDSLHSLSNNNTSSPSPSSTSTTTNKQKTPTSKDSCDDDKALELRRQRNRESMRRTRQRDKQSLTDLRTTLSRLELQYSRLLPPCPALATTATATSSATPAFPATNLQHKLQQLVQLRRTLEAEKVHVEHALQQHATLAHDLQSLVCEDPLDDLINDKLALLADQHHENDGFTPLTHAHVQRLIASFCAELARVARQSPATTASSSAMAQPASHDQDLVVFGWHTQRHVDAHTNEMHFEFAKTFDHITASDLTQRAWSQGMDVHKFRTSERRLNIRRLEFLQHFGDDVKVMVREIVHPVDATVFRTNYLTFKRATHDGGFVVGIQSINPPPQSSPPAPREDTDTAERVVYIDAYVSVELRACGPQSCHVCWRGRTNYKSPQYAAESAVQFLMGVLRWEAALIGPLLQLF